MDTEKIKSIMKMFEESQISKMDLTDGDLHITLEKDIEAKQIITPTDVKTPSEHNEETIQEKATVSGKVLSIEVQDGQTFEYDQTLMMIG